MSSTQSCQLGGIIHEHDEEQHEDASVAAALLFCGTHYGNLEHNFMKLMQESDVDYTDQHCYLGENCLLPSGEIPVLEICAGVKLPCI
jgi:hypothetical protein